MQLHRLVNVKVLWISGGTLSKNRLKEKTSRPSNVQVIKTESAGQGVESFWAVGEVTLKVTAIVFLGYTEPFFGSRIEILGRLVNETD